VGQQIGQRVGQQVGQLGTEVWDGGVKAIIAQFTATISKQAGMQIVFLTLQLDRFP
jgi:hypothetical protein